jgi:hypothetical protein
VGLKVNHRERKPVANACGRPYTVPNAEDTKLIYLNYWPARVRSGWIWRSRRSSPTGQLGGSG